MKEKNYLEQPGADCPLWSSAVVGQLCRGRGISPLQLPQPGVSARPGDEEGTGFFVWNVKSPQGTHVFPLFKYDELAKRRELLTFRPLEEGEMFLFDGRLYMVKFDRRRGFYLRHVFFFYHQCLARSSRCSAVSRRHRPSYTACPSERWGAEAAIRGFAGAEFMLCRVYVIGRVKKLLGVCWIGWVPETGDTLFVKLFQDDVDRFMAYDPLELAREAIDEGETFYDHGRFWKLCRDENDAWYVEEAAPLAKMSVVRG